MALGKTAKSILKWAVYSFVLLLLYTLQASPALFSIHGIKPVFVIPMAVSVALFENEVGAGAFGLAAGLLWDFSAGKLFGFYGHGTDGLLRLHFPSLHVFYEGEPFKRRDLSAATVFF